MGEQRDRVEQHVDAALDDDRYVGAIPDELRAELDDELGEPADTPTGCAIGCVALLAVLLLVAIVGGGLWLLAGWL